MQVTFVYPDILECDPGYQGAFYCGLGLLSAVLKSEGFHTSLIHITSPVYTEENFATALRKHNSQLIAFSSTTNGHPVVKRLAAFLERNGCHIPTIYGGIHPTLAPEESIQTPGINMICVGEGERCLVDVCKALEQRKDLFHIPNLWLKNEKKIISNQLRPLIADLDQLPFADRDLFDYPNLYNERRGMATFMASRGCPYSCHYCANKALRSLYHPNGRYVRFRSVENLIEEIKWTVQKYPFFRRVHFDDDILFMKRQWVQEFVNSYPREVGLPFCCNIHPTLCSDETIRMLAEAGCDEVRIGLESGNATIRELVLNRHMSNDLIIKAFHMAKAQGIKAKSFNMIGIPHENPASILDTIKLNARAGVDEIQHTIFHPYPGTRLFEICQEENIFSNRSVSSYYIGSILDLPELPTQHLTMFHRYFHTLVKVYASIYRLPELFSKILIRLLDLILTLPQAPTILRWVRPVFYTMRIGISKIKGVIKNQLKTFKSNITIAKM